jgi:hypothetical protein
MRRSKVRILLGIQRSQMLGFFVPWEKQSGATVVGYGCPLTTSSGCGASGSAPGLGPGGWRFESCHPDK